MSFLDEWDENFLMEAIRIEDEAFSSRNPHKEPPPDPPNPPPHSSSSSLLLPPHAYSFRPPPNPAAATATVATTFLVPEPAAFPTFPSFGPGDARGSVFDAGDFSFSPPRELSQRLAKEPKADTDCEIFESFPSRNGGFGNRVLSGSGEGGGTRKDKEIERLKRELGRVSKQLSHLETERMELKKDRAKKDQQLGHAFLQIEAKDAEIYSLRMGNLEASRLDPKNTRLHHVVEVGRDHVNEDKYSRHISPELDSTANLSCVKFKEVEKPFGCLSVDQRISRCYDKKREDIQTHHSTEVSEFEHHNLIDYGLTTSSKVIIEDNRLSEKAAQSKDNRTEGAQSDAHKNCSHVSPTDLAQNHISNKLLALWGFSYNKKTGKSIMSKLLASCWQDFCVLFRCMNTASKLNLDFEADKIFSDMALLDDAPSAPTSDATKVMHLYNILVKMQTQMAELHDLIEGLLDMCILENAILVHRSLRILNAILQYLLSFKTGSNSRNNISVDQPFDNNMHEGRGLVNGDQIMDTHNLKRSSESEISRFCLTDVKVFDKDSGYRDRIFLSAERLVPIFQTMQQITMRNKEEDVQVEAISIMILILMGSNSTTERDMFRVITVLDCVSQLLGKEVGLHVHKQAVHLLFLVLNCPKILMLFCNEVKQSNQHSEATDGHNDSSRSTVSLILEGLADCLLSHGSATMELKLRKQVIKLLAYIAACGKNGFEVLNSQGPNRGNFLELIIQVLASEMEAEIANFAECRTLCKERTSLIREALILLNRLVSNSVYSRTTLGVLTGKRSTASLTIDVANRIPHESRGCWKNGGAKTTQVEAEIVDLARLFRVRVFSFLGGKPTS